MKSVPQSFMQERFSSTNVPFVDFQMHTRWTDGSNTVREMYEQAVRVGLSAMLFSEHARRTSEEWFGRFAAEVRALPELPCRAFVGVETRIEDVYGNIDCTPAILAQCDMVLASVHRFPDGNGGLRSFESVNPAEAEALEFALASAALDNPSVTVLAHPFGMCYRRYKIAPSEKRIRLLIEKAAKTGVAFEVNAYYHPEPWTMLRWCWQAGAAFSLGSDAHHRDEVGNIHRVLTGKPMVWNRSESS